MIASTKTLPGALKNGSDLEVEPPMFHNMPFIV